MLLPVVQGLIERRVLVNFRVQADVLQAQLPRPFRVQTVGGFGMAGVCLIRLAQERPRFVPSFLGLRSENAAHRVAVERDTPAGPQRGVFVLRRDTSSALNAFVGGRFFPGTHHRARFDVRETADEVAVALRSEDGDTRIAVRGRRAAEMPKTSVFPDVAAASAFFEQGALGWSPAKDPQCFDCLELVSHGWRVEPLAVEEVESSWFQDAARFPAGSVAFDSALLMRDVAHEWRSHARLRVADA
ncbi:MAG TPA: DUF2071 domain-containing protein [Planctomycetota bacterium]|nr:DUF2071 domain-containing protein [Planctomycetota bacterium]